MKHNRIFHLILAPLILALSLMISAVCVFADGEPVDISGAAVDSCETAGTYTGKPLRQTPVVILNGSTLVEGLDYTVSYKNNRNVGTATVTIKGTGDYTGKIKRTFMINPKGTSITKTSRSYTYVKLTWKKQSSKMSKSRITGYKVRYSKAPSMADSKVRGVKGYSRNSLKITGLAADTSYYFQVRTYKVSGKKTYYSDWSAPELVTTKSYDTADYYTYSVVKAGKFVYIAAGSRIYKVNVNTNKKSVFAKSTTGDIGALSIHGGYLYYITDTYRTELETPILLCRTSLSTKKAEAVAPAFDYYIADNQICYSTYSSYIDGYYDGEALYEHHIMNWMVMNTDGSGMRDTGNFGYESAGKYKECNVKGYSRYPKFVTDEKIKVYLTRPKKKKLYIGTEYAMTGVPYTWVEDEGYFGFDYEDEYDDEW